MRTIASATPWHSSWRRAMNDNGPTAGGLFRLALKAALWTVAAFALVGAVIVVSAW